MSTTAVQPSAEQLFEAGRYDEALIAWQAIADRDPGSARAQARVGACLARNIKRISPACRAVMSRHSKASHHRKKKKARR